MAKAHAAAAKARAEFRSAAAQVFANIGAAEALARARIAAAEADARTIVASAESKACEIAEVLGRHDLASAEKHARAIISSSEAHASAIINKSQSQSRAEIARIADRALNEFKYVEARARAKIALEVASAHAIIKSEAAKANDRANGCKKARARAIEACREASRSVSIAFTAAVVRNERASAQAMASIPVAGRTATTDASVDIEAADQVAADDSAGSAAAGDSAGITTAKNSGGSEATDERTRRIMAVDDCTCITAADDRNGISTAAPDACVGVSELQGSADADYCEVIEAADDKDRLDILDADDRAGAGNAAADHCDSTGSVAAVDMVGSAAADDFASIPPSHKHIMRRTAVEDDCLGIASADYWVCSAARAADDRVSGVALAVDDCVRSAARAADDCTGSAAVEDCVDKAAQTTSNCVGSAAADSDDLVGIGSAALDASTDSVATGDRDNDGIIWADDHANTAFLGEHNVMAAASGLEESAESATDVDYCDVIEDADDNDSVGIAVNHCQCSGSAAAGDIISSDRAWVAATHDLAGICTGVGITALFTGTDDRVMVVSVGRAAVDDCLASAAWALQECADGTAVAVGDSVGNAPVPDYISSISVTADDRISSVAAYDHIACEWSLTVQDLQA